MWITAGPLDPLPGGWVNGSKVGAVATVVVADPDDGEREAMAQALAEAGYEVLAVRDGEEALRAVRERPAALLVVAEETGPWPPRELLRRLRAATAAPIVVVGDERRLGEVEALRLGADYYDHRPVLAPLLLARVRSLLRRWRPPEGRPGRASRR
jgi:DNA-binding response OmpR family regulator